MEFGGLVNTPSSNIALRVSAQIFTALTLGVMLELGV